MSEKLLPSRNEAEKLLSLASELNPGPWTEHCRVTGRAAETIAKKCGLDAKRAYVSGLFEARYVGADSFFGNDTEFLDRIPEGLVYFVDVKKNRMVFTERPDTAIPEYSGRGRKPIRELPSFSPCTVEDIAKDESIPWNDVVLDIGAQGPIITQDKYLRVVESIDGLPRNDIWLYIRKLDNKNIKYALCNESPDATIEDLRKPALMRWSIEQCFKECKDYLGMDHYESRSWPAWYRHILLCHVAHLFILKLRKEFSCNQQKPSVAPYINKSVPLEDYLDATAKHSRSESINHPNIMSSPDKKQHVLTIGLTQMIISAALPKIGALMQELGYQLSNFSKAYESHAKSNLEKAYENYYGLPLRLG